MHLPPSSPSVPSTASTVMPLAWRATLARTVRECALQDWFILAYHIVLWFAAWQGSGPLRGECLSRMSVLMTLHVVTLVLVRGRLLRNDVIAPLLYRLVVYGGVQLSYFILRDLLPTASPYALDPELYRLDVRLFGAEPTLVADAFVTSFTTEWFSFFYYSYFFLLAVHVLPFLFASRRSHLFADFALSIFFVFCTAHIIYMIVPGYGPYRYLAGLYRHDLPHGFFYRLVLDAVAVGGAQKDIFPSLHTAAPTMLAVFSFLHRNQKPFRYTWPVVAFWALNIMGATIFLRWHYAVDVVAGFTLGVCAPLLAGRVAAWESARRERLGLTLTWPTFGDRPALDRPAATAPLRLP